MSIWQPNEVRLEGEYNIIIDCYVPCAVVALIDINSSGYVPTEMEKTIGLNMGICEQWKSDCS